MCSPSGAQDNRNCARARREVCQQIAGVCYIQAPRNTREVLGCAESVVCVYVGYCARYVWIECLDHINHIVCARSCMMRNEGNLV